MSEETVALAAIALVGTILTFVVTPLFKLLNSNTKALESLAKSNQDLVSETKKGNFEAKTRNGHLGEQNEHITKLVLNHSKEAQALVDVASSKVVSAMKDIETQNVRNQHIDKSTVKEETIEHETKK